MLHSQSGRVTYFKLIDIHQLNEDLQIPFNGINNH